MMIQAQAQTPFAMRARNLVGAVAILVALGLSAAGGYAIGTASAQVAQAGTTATGAYPIQLGPASRWTHEERPFTPIQLGPALRSTHEEP
jgi:hypothetical protein